MTLQQHSLSAVPPIAESFSIVGYLLDVTPKNTNDEFIPGVELADPEVIFQYPPPLPPNEDDSDISFIIRYLIKMQFFRPDGYRPLTGPRQPSFKSLALNKLVGNNGPFHAAVFTYYEPFRVDHISSCDSHYFVPKFMIFLSKINNADLLKQCLYYIYTQFFIKAEDVKLLNWIIAVIVQKTTMPLPGHIRHIDFGSGFSLTVNAQGPLCPPDTSLNVFKLFHRVGINLVVDAVRCLLNEVKIVVYSQDLSLVTQSCEALIGLLWPFPYNYVYAPDVSRCVFKHLLQGPSTFFVGTSYLPENFNILCRENGIVLIDLDEHKVVIPPSLSGECLNFDRDSHKQLFQNLTCILFGKDEESWTDCSRDVDRARQIEMKLRACFIKLYAEIFCQYRLSLVAVRFFPYPQIYFDASNFLGRKGLRKDDTNSLVCKLLNSFFTQFFDERYHPYREIDFFDELCANNKSWNIEEIADRLLKVDSQSSWNIPEATVELISSFLSTAEISSRTLQRPCCLEIAEMVTCQQKDISAASELIAVDIASTGQCLVPVGDLNELETSDGHRAECLCQAVGRLFSSDSSAISLFDRKLLDSVVFESPEVRRKFCSELSLQSLKSDGSRLNRKNFDYLANLVIKLSEAEGEHDESCIISALLQAVSNISHRPGPSEKPIYLHQQLSEKMVLAWWNENFWTSWLGRFIGAELAAYYNNEKPNIYKEPGYSAKVLGKLIEENDMATFKKQRSEEHKVINAFRLCIDVMLTLLLAHPVLPSSPDKTSETKTKTFFKKLINVNSLSPKSKANHHQRVVELISSVILDFSEWTKLRNEDREKLIFSFREKIQNNLLMS